MKNKFSRINSRKIFFQFVLTIYLSLSGVLHASAQDNKKPVIIGYVGGFNGNLVETSLIDANRLTHINYAFVDIKDNLAWLHNEKTDTVNFRKLNELKKINPDLKISISVGGWTWSKHFSDATFTDELTRDFAQSMVDIVLYHDLDGVDIDWEYPGIIGDDNTYRPEDGKNYTNLFRYLRKQLDTLEKRTGKK